jgi:hypothetical protein
VLASDRGQPFGRPGSWAKVVRHRTSIVGLVLAALLLSACAARPVSTPTSAVGPTATPLHTEGAPRSVDGTPTSGPSGSLSAQTEVVNLDDQPIAVLASVLDPTDGSFRAAGVTDVEPGGFARQSIPPATYRLEFVSVDGTDMAATPAPSILATIGSCTLEAGAGDLYQFAFAGGVGIVVRNDEAPPDGVPMDITLSPLCRVAVPSVAPNDARTVTP